LYHWVFVEDDFKNLVDIGAIQDAPLTADEARAILNFFGTQSRTHLCKNIELKTDYDTKWGWILFFRLVFSLAGASSQGFFKLLSSAPKGHASFAQLLPHVQSLLGPDCFLRVVVCFTWKILTLETIFDSLFLGAFPEDASFLVLPA